MSYFLIGEVPRLEEPAVRFMEQWLEREAVVDEVIRFTDCQTDSSFYEFRPLLVDHQIHALLAARLTHKSQAIGFVALHQCVPYRKWEEDSVALLAAAVGHLGMSIHNLRSLAEAQKKAFTDSLTGLCNRRFVEQRLAVELKYARQQRAPLTLAIADIDHFKRINDTYGHPAGDNALKRVAFFLKTNVRKGCTVGRFGGEEFVVVLPNLDLETSRQIMDQFRERLAELLEVEGTPITVSIGVATAQFDEILNLAEIQHRLFADADARLYIAKRQGRNRVVWEDVPCEVPSNL